MKNVKFMKTKYKKIALTGSLLSAMVFLSGCMRFDLNTGEPKGFLSEIIYNVLIGPLQKVLHFFGNGLGNYGLAIIVFTVIFRLVLLPLTLKQQKSMTENQLKMSAVQPAIQEIQAELKATEDPQEQQALNLELMQMYRDNDISLGGQLSSGCLPLLLQMPIFVAMLQVLRHTEEISHASFLGIELGERSILLAVLTGALYFFQSRMMIKDMPEEQQKTAGSTMYVTPVMMLMLGMSGPAGVALYWLVSGVFTLGQQLLNQNYLKPKIEREVQEKLGDIKVVERKKKQKPQPVADENNETSTTKNNTNRNRNAGKQQRKK